MKLSYQLASISYCPDLTDPNAVSLPIAVLAVGKASNAEEFWSAAIVGVDAKRMGIDPLSTAMLADVPHMIRRHVDAAMKKLTADATPDVVLRAFHESLKTSIHVSAISERREVEVRDARGLATALIDPSFVTLERSMHELTGQLAQGLRAEWSPRVSPERLMAHAPEQLFWQPTSPEMAIAAA